MLISCLDITLGWPINIRIHVKKAVLGQRFSSLRKEDSQGKLVLGINRFPDTKTEPPASDNICRIVLTGRQKLTKSNQERC